MVMRSMPTDSRLLRGALALLGAIALGTLAGCIADTAEDSDLPWSSNQKWEGMGPLPSIMTDNYD